MTACRAEALEAKAGNLKPQVPLFSLPLFPPSCSLKLAHFLLASAILFSPIAP